MGLSGFGRIWRNTALIQLPLGFPLASPTLKGIILLQSGGAEIQSVLPKSPRGGDTYHQRTSSHRSGGSYCHFLCSAPCRFKLNRGRNGTQ